METGHELLHHFENSIHHHKVSEAPDHHHNLADHQINEPGDDNDALEIGLNMITLAVGMFAQEQPLDSFSLIDHVGHDTMFVCVYNSITRTPPTPPPLG
jgi:hypothetical protein